VTSTRETIDKGTSGQVTTHTGKALSWHVSEGVIEMALHLPPCNEIGTVMLGEMEQFVAALATLESSASALIIHSEQSAGFSAGADLRELYAGALPLAPQERVAGVRAFLERIHNVLNVLDDSSLTTIAAVHGVTFGGGFELALACDLIVADKMARFCFPELRLGLIPGFGGIEGARGRPGQPGSSRGQSAARSAIRRGPSRQVRPHSQRRRQAIPQAHPARRAKERNRFVLRTVRPPRRDGRSAKVRRKHGRAPVSAVSSISSILV